MVFNKELTRREFLTVSAGAAAGVAGLGKVWGGEDVKEGVNRPNILFVMSDQQRRHALGFMNQDPVITPHIDKFAAESLVLTDALTAYPVCGPYRATLMTGRYPCSTGLDDNEKGLQLSEVGFGTALKDAGYQTGYIGKWHIYDNGLGDWRLYHFNDKGQFVPKEHRFGFDYWHAVNCNHRTFYKLYYEDSKTPVVNEEGWQITHETDTAINYIKNIRKKDAPFALFISMVPPHNTHGPGFEPYILRPEEEKVEPLYRTQYHAPKKYEDLYRGKDLKRRDNVETDYGKIALPGYFGGCTAVDDEFGRMMKCLEEEGLVENTIVVYTSDHGEMMGSHGRFQKGFWYEESIGIPFIIRWPEKLKPGRNDVLLNSVDVMPTILGLIGAAIPKPVEGKDLSQVFLGQTGDKPKAALAQHKNWRALRTSRYTFVAEKRPNKTDLFFYDNQKDPYQKSPVRKGQGQDETFNSLLNDLKMYLLQTRDRFFYYI
jgi:arylsulfatase A-like enzyme